MDSTEFVQADQSAIAPFIRIEPLTVNPAGSIGVALDLHVCLERFGADSAALLEQRFDLAKHEGVPFESRGVVGLEVPNVGPGRLCLLRRG